MKISKDKKYKLRMGGDIKIYEILDGYVFGAYRVKGSKEFNAARWECNGNYLLDSESCLDLIEISPYADFKIDDKVLVWNHTKNIISKCYFAGIDDHGNPQSWHGGRTSFNETLKLTWQNCEKYEENND